MIGMFNIYAKKRRFINNIIKKLYIALIQNIYKAFCKVYKLHLNVIIRLVAIIYILSHITSRNWKLFISQRESHKILRNTMLFYDYRNFQNKF